MASESYRTVEFKFKTDAERKEIIESYESQGYFILQYLPSVPPVEVDGVTIYSMSLFMGRTDD